MHVWVIAEAQIACQPRWCRARSSRFISRAETAGSSRGRDPLGRGPSRTSLARREISLIRIISREGAGCQFHGIEFFLIDGESVIMRHVLSGPTCFCGEQFGVVRCPFLTLFSRFGKGGKRVNFRYNFTRLVFWVTKVVGKVLTSWGEFYYTAFLCFIEYVEHRSSSIYFSCR